MRDEQTPKDVCGEASIDSLINKVKIQAGFSSIPTIYKSDRGGEGGAYFERNACLILRPSRFELIWVSGVIIALALSRDYSRVCPGAMYKLRCSRYSLRTAGIFPVVASLPQKREATTGNTSALRRLLASLLALLCTKSNLLRYRLETNKTHIHSFVKHMGSRVLQRSTLLWAARLNTNGHS